MQYLQDPQEIRAAIDRLSQASQLWLDTEVADWRSPQPRLSLIQALAGDIPTGEDNSRVVVLDVLDRGDLIEEFIERVMAIAAIEKVFHNASFDRRFLGQQRARNVTCTLQMARRIPKPVLGVTDRKLVTLTRKFCPGSAIDKTEQSSDWGRRPLSSNQLHYAGMDVVYLAQVHCGLQQFGKPATAVTASDNLPALVRRYREIERQWQELDREVAELKDRIKAAMQIENLTEIDRFTLKRQQRVTQKVSLAELAATLQESGQEVDLQISLTKAYRDRLGEDLLGRLTILKEETEIVQLKIRALES